MDNKKIEEDKQRHPVTGMNNKRSWVLVAAWFGTIAFVGLLKRVLERQSTI